MGLRMLFVFVCRKLCVLNDERISIIVIELMFYCQNFSFPEVLVLVGLVM